MVLNTSIHQKFKNSFEQKCFQLLIGAYQILLTEKVVQSDWEENDISQALYEKIDIDTRRFKWKIVAFREFHLPQNTVKVRGFANKLPRIDLIMSNIFGNLDCKYFCEAKRLKETDSNLKRAYIGEGMDRFISKKYPIGCMLGYLLDGDLDNTIKGINSLLDKDNRKAETLSLTVNTKFKFYYESNHTKIGVLKHFIFAF